MSLLRPLPHRGDQLAAGVVLLTLFVSVLISRFEEDWADGVTFAIVAAVAAWVTALAMLSPRESKAPRGYQSVLYVASFVMATGALTELAALVTGDDYGSGTTALIALAVALLGGFYARDRESAVSAFLAAGALVVAIGAGIDWAWEPEGSGTYRWVMLALATGFGLAAVAQRDRRPEHGVSFANVAGLLVLGIAGTFLLESALGIFATALSGEEDAEISISVGWGWELLIGVTGLGLVGYAAVDRMRGPGWIGVANLVAFTVFAADDAGDASFIGWPLALALITLALLIIALRPSRPLPPPPDAGAPPAAPAPLQPGR